MSRIAPVLLGVIVLWVGRADAAAPAVPDDPLPVGAILRLGSARLRHPVRITALALSPDGRVLASADADDLVRLWDTADGRLRTELLGGGTAVAFSPDGRLLLTSKRDGGRLWDVASGKLIRQITALGATAAAFSADGKHVAGTDNQHRVVVCETATGDVAYRLTGLSQRPEYFAFSPDGKALATGGSGAGKAGGHEVVIWDLSTRKVRCQPVNEKGGWVYGVAFSPDSETLAVATRAHVRLYDAHAAKQTRELKAGRYAVSFDRAGRLVTGGALSVWDLKKDAPLWTARQSFSFHHVAAVSADGSLVALAAIYDKRIRLWNGWTGKPLLPHGHLDEVRGVAWSPDGKQVATGCGGDGTVRLWDAANGAARRVLPRLPGEANYRSRSRDLSMLAFSGDGRILTGPGQRWSLVTGEPAESPPVGRPMAYSPDGRFVAIGDRDRGGIQVQDAAGCVAWRIWASEEDRPRDLRCLAFSPNGRLLAVGQDDAGGAHDEPAPTVLLFEIATGKLVLQTRLARHAPEEIVFSPDGRLLATSEFRGAVQLFDAVTGRERFRLPEDRSGRHWDGVRPLAFSPDGALLATQGARGEIALYETASGRAIRSWKAHDGLVRSLAFSPDGKRLLSGGADAIAIVWHVLLPVARKAWDKGTADRLWLALAADAAEAYPAIAKLLASSETVGLLEKKLRADADVDPRRIERLIADLDAEDFAVRQKAEDALAALNERAEPALRRALLRKPELEPLRRIQRLLRRLEAAPSGDDLRDRRALLVLERIGSPAAEALLEKLARGGEWGRKTLISAATLERMEAARRRTKAAPVVAKQDPAGRAPRRLGEHKGEVHAIAFAPDGKAAYTAGHDGKVRRWDVGAAKEDKRIDAHQGGAFALAVSDDGKRLATAGADGKVRLWELPAVRLAQTLDGHKGGSLCVAFSPDGKTLASGGADGRIRVWATADGKAGQVIHVTDGRVASIVFTADGKRLLAGSTSASASTINGRAFSSHDSQAVRYWSVDGGKPVGELKQEGHAVRQTAGGRLTVVTLFSTATAINGDEEGPIHLYSPQVVLRESATRKEVLALKGCGTVDVSGDGRFLLTAPGNTFAIGGKARLDYGDQLHPEVRLWEVASGEEVLRLSVKDVAAVAFASDGARALLGTRDGAVFLADLRPPGVEKENDPDVALWDRLGGRDAVAAYCAGVALIARGDRAAKFLAARFRPAPAGDKALRQTIAELNEARHVDRRDAFEALAARGAEAGPVLMAALKGVKDERTQWKIEELLRSPRASRPPNAPQLERAAWILDRIGTAEAAKAKRALAEWRK